MTEERTNTQHDTGISVGGQRPPLAGDLTLSDNARTVLEKRYLRRDGKGEKAETIEEMFWRVAWNIARSETHYGGSQQATAERFFHMLAGREFFPNSPTFTGAGTPLGQLAACFVLPLSDDMGRHGDGIFETLRDAALIQQTGGGNGFAFSRLRPSGTIVKSSNGKATGPLGFLRVYDQAFDEIAQGGSRRGANMAVLRVDHPDIEQFITCKTDENTITNFNISVGITDAFMKAVKDDASFELRFPDVHDPRYRGFSGTINEAEKAGIPIKSYGTVRARELFEKIVAQAYHNGEPGMLFLDEINRTNPVPHIYEIEATNPCGEQALAPYESCCLGSINLAEHLTADGRVDWTKLQKTTDLATRFLDDVIDANAYVPAVPQLEEAAKRVRRIGLGIMGLADMMAALGVRYGSQAGQDFAGLVMEYIQYHCMKTSILLARERGAFPAIRGSIYDPDHFTWEPPSPITPYTRTWDRPSLHWEEITAGIVAFGIRNGAQSTIAPTGTISTVAGCEGYGCEPIFALAYTRYFNDGETRRELQYTSPLFDRALKAAGIAGEAYDHIIQQVNETGSCQGIDDLPATIRDAFVVAADITAEEHVRMQAAMQRFVSNSISKTCNFPEGAAPEDVAKAFQLAWELGCKGLTVYVAGSRDTVVLETRATKKARTAEGQAAPAAPPKLKKARDRVLIGKTFRIDTPLGTTFITVNENGGDDPFEVFIHTSKAGSETAAVSEAIGRLISYILRINSPVTPADRLREVVRQLGGIGGDNPLGMGPFRVRSLPDAVAQVIEEYLNIHDSEAEEGASQNHAAVIEVNRATTMALPVIDPSQKVTFSLCPSCGMASLVREEGCLKCYSCGYSKC